MITDRKVMCCSCLMLKEVTMHSEKCSIHFYVNKCGFKIVLFFNKAYRYVGWVSSYMIFVTNIPFFNNGIAFKQIAVSDDAA